VVPVCRKSTVCWRVTENSTLTRKREKFKWTQVT
jgi:hypothetical protein